MIQPRWALAALALCCFATLVSAPLEAQEVCATASGATVIAEDGTYLGKIASEYNVESIFNDYGKYGGKYSGTSIWNEYGRYGGEYSRQSPFNKYSSTPPALIKSGKVIGYLTVAKSHPGAVNPYVLKSCDF